MAAEVMISGLNPIIALFVVVYELVGGGVVGGDWASRGEFRFDFFGELFAEFDPHLVV